MSNRLTIKDVAKKANVSIATVSNVINGTGRVSVTKMKHVQRVIEELNYHPSTSARNLKDKNSNLIGLVVPFLPREYADENPFYWSLIKGIETYARNHKFHVLFLEIEEDELFSFVHERHLDGVIVLGADKEAPYLSKLLELNVPCVFMDSYLPDHALYQVLVDDRHGGYLATKHLLDLGHKNIAMLAGNLQEGGVNYERWCGYKQALQEYDISYDERLVIEAPSSLAGGYDSAQQVRQFLPQVTAVFSLSDIGAIGLIKGLHQSGISVPDDISVVGFDDLPYAAYITPPLTTVRQDIALKGRAAVELLLGQVSESATIKKRHTIIPVELKVRQSTIPLNE